MVRNKAPDIPQDSLAAARQRRHAETLLVAQRDFIRGMALKLCGNHADADDLLQDVTVKILRNHSVLPKPGQERPWLAAVAHNSFIDRVRRAAARKESAREELDTVAGAAAVVAAPSEPWWHGLSSDDVRAQVAQLSAELRSAFELFTFEGKSYIEIAAQLQISKATVGTRILRARQRLRELLEARRPLEERHE